MTQLVVEGHGVSVTLDPGRAYRLGRDPRSDVVVSDERVSRTHAELRFEGGQWMLEDVGSRGGTYLGGRRVQRVVVAPGSRIDLGHPTDGGTITFRAPTAAPTAPPPQATPWRPGAWTPPPPPGARLSPPQQDARTSPPGAQPPPQPGARTPSPQPGARIPPRQPAAWTPPPPASAPAAVPPPASAPAPVPPPRPAPYVSGRQPAQPGGAVPMATPTPTLRLAAPSSGPAQPGGAGPTPTLRLPRSGQWRQPATVRDLGGAQIVSIGRAPENDIVLTDLRVSRRHAELRIDAGGHEIVDVGSRMGTYVNGQRVQRARVTPDDLIGIGPSSFQLVGDTLMEYADTGEVCLQAHDLTVTVGDGKVLLDHVSFPVGEKCLLAVIGPSGSGKSTLLRALTGLRPADQGVVTYDGRDLYRDYAELRSRIGLVPQDDILHSQLTVRRALIYAAELRFPDDTRQHERKARVDEVLQQLGLANRKDNRISSLSGGQRKRVSVALELLTKPSLLFLDEPTSGLDPGLDKSVMQMLRGLADEGRTVAVVTHSVANLDICDRLLVMAPGGKIAYFGPPDEALPFLGFTDWADVFIAFDDPARDWAGEYARSPEYQQYIAADLIQPVAAQQPVQRELPPKQQSWPEQLSTLVRRYCRGIVADRLFLGITVALPIVMGLLARVVPTGNLMGPPNSNGNSANLLLILCIGGCLTGSANAVRELVKERAIYQRERAVGLSRSAYLCSKMLVLGVITVAQGVVLTYVAMLNVKTYDTGVFTAPMIELSLAVALLSFTAMTVGLLISALAKTSETTMPLLVLVTLVQLVFCGALVHLDDKPVMEQLSWLVPARWALAALAATLDVGQLIPHIQDPPDPLWSQDFGTWLLDMSALAALAVVCAFLVARMLRRHEPAVMRGK
ncbi:FHA domain-containing protein [Nonomuraea fuscirosea]|uniref:FHA domain-containing protein n=1 Tax=Nonomuraea fuscirosea TaxID=1291556 RepID=UPI00341CA38E